MSALLTYRSRDSFESRLGQTNKRLSGSFNLTPPAKLLIIGIDETSPLTLIKVLSTLPSHALVISIATDGLFTTSEQELVAAHIAARQGSGDTFS